MGGQLKRAWADFSDEQAARREPFCVRGRFWLGAIAGAALAAKAQINHTQWIWPINNQLIRIITIAIIIIIVIVIVIVFIFMFIFILGFHLSACLRANGQTLLLVPQQASPHTKFNHHLCVSLPMKSWLPIGQMQHRGYMH